MSDLHVPRHDWPLAVSNVIGGVDSRPLEGRPSDRRYPADSRLVATTFPNSGGREVDAAVEAARFASTSWSSAPASHRHDVVSAIVDALEHQRAALVASVIADTGKPSAEANAEFTSTVAEARNAIAVAQSQDDAGPTWLPGNTTALRPHGVVGLITTWNFPVSVLWRKLVPALLGGNAVVIKPSELAPASAWVSAQIAASALPAGVVNLVYGEGPTVGAAIVEHPGVGAISFTGSTPTGHAIARSLAGTGRPAQLELGGSNPVVVLPDADIDQFVNDVVGACYTCAGQWCVATGRIVAHQQIYDEVVDRVVAEVEKLRAGAPDGESTNVGPMITQEALVRFGGHIDAAIDQGATRRAATLDPDLPPGWYAAPTVLVGVTPAMSVANEELFGPGVSMMSARDVDDAIDIANNTRFGLSASIYTHDEAAIDRFADTAEFGNIHLNKPTSLRTPGLPFGGWKHSGVGPPESGRYGLAFYSRPQARYR